MLARRHARRVGVAGDPALARSRARLSRRLWRDYGAFDTLRRRFRRRNFEPPARGCAMRRLLDRMVSAGLIIRSGRKGSYSFRSPAAKRYLTGGWLEELGWLAMVAAGADEACFGQQIEWNLDGHQGRNEIDVIGRRGNILSFVSCKTAAARHRGDRRTTAKFTDFLHETHYWDLHFAAGDARAMLLVTTDLIDEAKGDRPRSELLFTRATVLDVDLIGRDAFDWSRLVNAMRDHWEG